MNSDHMSQPLVVSYIRFSTPRQASGDSLRRQTAGAREWCARHGWTLDEKLSIHDLGVSGFNKDNISRGALATFLQAVSGGLVPQGSYLIIENLDRLTRADLPTAVTLLLSIVQSGITCVTLMDGQEWSKERLTNPADFMLSVMLLYRGHDESRVKSQRIRAVHDRAREQLDRSVFGRAPGWLRRTADGSDWEEIPELVEIVKKVFEFAASGYGGVAIAKQANAENWLVPSLSAREKGTGWHTTLPTKLVRNRAVLGELEFHVIRDGQSTPSGQVVEKWYPEIISEELFFRANAAIDARRGKPNRRDATYRNVFQGVIFCGHCGATLARKAKAGSKKNSKGYAQYVCSDRHRGASSCPNYNAKELERALIPLLYRYFSEHLGDDTRLSSLRDELASVKGEISDLDKRRSRLAEAIEQAELPIPTLIKRLAECERGIPALESRAAILEAQLRAASYVPDNDNDADAVLQALYSDDDASERIRAETHMKMILCVEALWIWPREMVVVQLKADADTIALPLPDPTQKPEWIETPDGRAATFTPSPRLLGALTGQCVVPTPRRRKKAEEAID
ncbi:recombinase family protein [Burkholderia sp. 4M9327F10]|uniref:recombinase family protein n=2 Tax=Burkholderiaceae TaxID=119060 RepID=UPI0010F8DDC7